MGGKGGGSDGSDKMIAEQQRQAEEARRKEEERKARIKSGMESIAGKFEGEKVYKTKNQKFDWSGLTAPTVAIDAARMAQANPSAWTAAQKQAFQGSALPAGFEWVQTAAPTSAISNVNPNRPSASGRATPRVSNAEAGSPVMAGNRNVQHSSTDMLGNPKGLDYNTPSWSNRSGAAAAPAGGGQVWAIKGPDGKIHYMNDAFNYDTQVDTGKRTGGFDDAFYNDYKQGIVDYYQPQVGEQYNDAQKELTYRLARAGLLRSSMAAEEAGDLSRQYDLNSAEVRNKADQGAADLRTNVAGQRAKIENQLLSSEDPNAAASQATAAVRDISLDQPNMSPLSALFNIATIGTAGAMRGYQNQRAANSYGQIGRKAEYTTK